MYRHDRHDAGPGMFLLRGGCMAMLILLAMVFAACTSIVPTPDASKKRTPTPTATRTIRVPTALPTAPPPAPTKQPTILALPSAQPTAAPTGIPPPPPPLPTGVATSEVLSYMVLTQARNTRVPCHAPPTLATCTPTPVAAPTYTPVPPAATATATATPIPSPAASATPCTGPDPIWSCNRTVAQFEAEVARLINEHRALPAHEPWYWPPGIALDLRPDLSRAERGWSEYLVRNNLCEHGDYGTRAAQEGYTGWAWGNIGACGYPNPAETVQGWIDSPAHHWIMDESAAMTEFGVGAARFANNYVDVFVTIGCGGGIPCMAAPSTARDANPPPITGSGYRP